MSGVRDDPQRYPHFDIALIGGTVIDGSLAAVPKRIDVGIVGDRIAAIGDLGEATATDTIAADGLVVAPGFIDPHTHIEPALLDEGLASLAPTQQGVTTCLTAADGFGWAPLPRARARELWAATAGIYGPWPDGLETGSCATYLAAFEGRISVNLLPQVPHAAVRFAIQGWDTGTTTGPGLDRMRDLVDDWLDVGATGIAFGLDYEPGARATERELVELCRSLGPAGGTIAAHVRSQDAGRRAAWEELVRLGERTGCPVVVAHETLDDEGLELLEWGRRVVDISVETYLYPASSTHLAMFVPAADRVGGPETIAIRLRDATFNRRVAASLAKTIGAELAAGERIVFAASADPARVGQDLFGADSGRATSIGEIAAAVLRDDPDALFVFHHRETDRSRATLAATIAHPATIVASDGIFRPGRMHPRGYGTFPRILRAAVRDWHALDLPTAIHAMTGRTAARYRVPDRGSIAVGSIADVVIFDPATVTDRASWAQPDLPPIGIEHVFVAGQAVLRDGQPTAVRPGRLLAAA